MKQKKIGSFFKELRKEKGLTQEQLAEQFMVSGRTVSRWETGIHMPDLDILIEMADFYKIDIRDLLDGERKCEKMNNEVEDTLLKVAQYSNEEKNSLMTKLNVFSWIGVISFIISIVLNTREYANTETISFFCLGIAFGSLVLAVIFTSFYIGKFKSFKTRILQHK